MITDGIFVGRGIGSDALAAVNITAPLFLIHCLSSRCRATGKRGRFFILAQLKALYYEESNCVACIAGKRRP